MSLTILFCFLLVALGSFHFQKKRAFFLFNGLTLLWAVLVGGGFLPYVLSNSLESYEHAGEVPWTEKNTIVLLGSGLTKWPSSYKSSTPFGNGRVREAFRLYVDCIKQKKICRIIASGGDPHRLGITEAEVMKRELLEMGMPSENVILESKSNNTFQNAQYTRDLIRGSGDLVVLVTSGAHMKRALADFSHFNMHPIPAPADRMGASLTVIPISLNFLITDLAIHEYFGILQLHVYNALGLNNKI